MELTPKIFPWHMSEKAKILAHFSTQLAKHLDEFTTPRFLKDVKTRLKGT
jgi:hypothetical protein